MSAPRALSAAVLACTVPFVLGACGNSSSGNAASSVSTAASSAGAAAQSSTSGAAGTGTATKSGTTTASAASSSTPVAAPTTTSTTTPAGRSTTSATVSATTSSAPVAPSSAAAPKVTTPPAAPATLTPASASTVKGGVVDTTPVTTDDGAPRTGAAVTSQRLTYTVKGRTISYAYTAAGKQHLYKAMDDGTMMASANSSGAIIDFGDGTYGDGADLGAMACMPKTALAPFKDSLAPNKHTFAKAGTYTVKATTIICGDTGLTQRTVSYKVTVK